MYLFRHSLFHSDHCSLIAEAQSGNKGKVTLLKHYSYLGNYKINLKTATTIR